MSTHEIHPMKDPNVVMTDEPEVGSRPSYELTGLSRFQAEQLQYVQMLDLTQERDNSDANDMLWKPTLVTKHRVVHKIGQKRKCLVQVQWLMNGASWVDINAVRLQCPFVLIEYALRKKLFKLEDFKWVQQYAKSPLHLDNM